MEDLGRIRKPSRNRLEFKGYLRIYEIRNGDERLAWEGKNLVVNGGLEAVAELLASGASGKVITKMGAGDSNGGSCSTSPTDTGLVNEIIRKAVSSTVSGSSVRFSMIIQESEGNGSGSVNYNEVALFCDDGTMFSKLCHPPRLKDSSVSLRYEWEITVSAS